MTTRETKKKMAAGAKKPGDLIPMPDHQREFLRIHNKFVDNPAMELIMADDTPSGRDMKFGLEPLPWEKPMLSHENLQLQEARQTLFKCRNKECSGYNKEQDARYEIVWHRKEVPHWESSEGANKYTKELDRIRNRIDLKRFGRRTKSCFHVAVVCRQCGQRIKFVKHSTANRRLAQDPFISGPHQGRAR